MTKEEKTARRAVQTDQHLETGVFEIGGHYAVVTVGPIYHGILDGVTADHYFLRDASWVVETGRLSEFVKNPEKIAEEAEYVGRVNVERGSVMASYPTAPGKVTTR